MDEYKSLILQINVPLSFLQPDSQTEKIPVLLYIHGGGFVLGKIDLAHSTAHMVSQSITDSQPVVGVSIQYRVGALGFLSTPEGQKNFGFYDQRTALLWVQKFIAGFRGDKEDVTAFGESAGGMSICYHMIAKVPETGPLFKRVVLMSGVISPSMSPFTVGEATTMYEKLVETLGIDGSGGHVIEKLRELDVQKIVDATSEITGKGGQFTFVEDANWFGHEEPVTWDRIPELLGKCEWVNEVVLGTTGFEVLSPHSHTHSLH
jgi:carboxylesterase type B